MKVSVVYAGELMQSWLPLDVDEDTTVAEAIEQCGILAKFPEIDLTISKVGIYGKISSLKNVLKDGDRIEIYRKIVRVLDDEEDDDDD